MNALEQFVVVYLLLAAAGNALRAAYLRGVRKGREAGYAEARTIPIGHFKALSIGSDGLVGVVEVAEDVTLVP